MFTIEQIKAAHSKVKSGADFPAYVKDLKKLGVLYYDHFVSDGHTSYFGNSGLSLSGDAKYPEMEVAKKASLTELQNALKIHQAGKTDYPTFCRQAVESGVEKWKVNMIGMTCIYYDLAGNEMLTEQIPDV
ncbi:hypothetical protein DYBT9275_02344 [Dyadobacter sp. CECT 9275]|uniref:Phage envelope protein n=1 Tax=Dyadobacter helix TaxID=2822344 RepID=A0A916NLB7_9BACT|nr:DUF1398 family protein [Dyadobacter sp. CECT 9275]CAG4999921.1 hypothetical protein DYBT9275_02344 [Dyadobacter sp. CECT 9275]